MSRKAELFLIPAILFLAAGVRVWGIGYGLPSTYCRPDEDRLIAVALRLSPTGIGAPQLRPIFLRKESIPAA